MQLRRLLECTIDVTRPVQELSEIISAVLSCVPPDNQAEILRQLDDTIAAAMVDAEASDLPAKE